MTRRSPRSKGRNVDRATADRASILS